MSDILTERSEHILRIQLNRPSRKNAMTSAMYITLATPAIYSRSNSALTCS